MKRFIAPAMLVAFAVTACGGPLTLNLVGSPEVPAAEATVKARSTDNGNTSIELAVKHLAPPTRVNPQAAAYVVWVVGTETGAQPTNLGGLKVGDDLSGKFTAVTPLRAFQLFITAEPSQLVTRPTGRNLLTTTVAMKK